MKIAQRFRACRFNRCTGTYLEYYFYTLRGLSFCLVETIFDVPRLLDDVSVAN
jgi:hypothetical protein